MRFPEWKVSSFIKFALKIDARGLSMWVQESSNSLLQYKTHFKYTWHGYMDIDSINPINNKLIHIHIHWMN